LEVSAGDRSEHAAIDVATLTISAARMVVKVIPR
jgi:hypothetical protein